MSNTVSEDSKGHPSFRTIPGSKGFKITIDQTGPSLQLTFIDKELAEAVTKICNNVTAIIYSGGLSGQLGGALQTIEGKIEELEEMLDPLRLRPLILRTRCDICPA